MTPWWRSERLRLALAALLLVVGFARPTLPWKRALFEHVVVLDVTQSMNVEDMQLEGKPAARLAFAKRALHEALSELPCGSRLGWAIFTEYRTYLLYTPVEVCANRAELLAIANAVASEKMIDKAIVIEAMEEAIQKSARNRYGAENDIRALRNLLDAWRDARATALQTIVKTLTTGLLLALITGLIIKFKLFGGGQ